MLEVGANVTPENDDMPPNSDSDLRTRVVNVEHRSHDHKARLVAIEAKLQEHAIVEATRKVQWDNMSSKLDGIQGTLTWINRLIIGGIIVAVLAFITGGGLNMASTLTQH